MGLLHALAESWSSLYSGSALLRSAISFAHIGGLMCGGGCAVAADLGTLRAWRRGGAARHLELTRLHDVHRLVITSLAVVVVSGILLMLADLDAYVVSATFWIKMALVGAITVNGVMLMRTAARAEHGDERAWRRMRLVSLASLALWLLTTLVGAVLPNAL